MSIIPLAPTRKENALDVGPLVVRAARDCGVLP
jgi:hypothetical protein